MNLQTIHPAQLRRWILILSVAFSFFWNLGGAPLFDEDEGFFAEGTREMALNNDFVSTYVNKEARFDKPPLTNWLQYISAEIFGWNEFAFRFPSAAAATLWMIFIYLFVRRKSGEATAFYAALMAACSLQITIIGKAAIADALLNACLAGAMFCLYEVLNKGKRAFLLGFYALTGFGFLCKGPIAIMVPGAVTLIYLLRWNLWRNLLRIFYLPGILLFLIIALPWYGLQFSKMGDLFIQGFFFNHNMNRFQTAFEGHYGGILYFVPVLILGVLPFTGVIFAMFGKLRYLWYDRWYSFMLLWFTFVFIFFSLSGTKLHHYIIYGYTPLFVMAGWYVHYKTSLPLVFPSLLFLAILFLFPFLIDKISASVNDPYAAEVLRAATIAFDTTYLLQTGALIVVLCTILLFKKWPKEIKVWISGLVLLATVNGLIMPRVGDLLQQPVKDAAIFARDNKLSGLVVFDHYLPSFYFYSGLFAEERKPARGEIVLARMTNLKDYPNHELLFEKNGIVLARIK